ncbi:hypothetical protein EII32_08710 [Prevotella sp. OH937_COT-195]|nr:hypothetical protein EII32_08710 [Prevotella sp. OH937_COT-195]
MASFVSSAWAQTDDDGKKVTLSGSVQSDILIPTTSRQDDKSNEDFRTNTYVDANVMNKYVDAGLRFSYLEHPLPGFEKDFKGWGVPFFYVKGKLKNVELTLGHYYEQFGSGFILRTYEERTLGIDNSLLGGRLVVKPFNGVQIKALAGKQRRYWSHNKAWISGADMELNINEWSKKMQESGTYITLGASWVNKHEAADYEEVFVDATHKLKFPCNVNAYDFRARFQKGGFSVLAEYAGKTQDPSFDNGYNYRKGYVAMLSTSYSQKGMSILLQAKRSDNFAFRSRRSMAGTSSFLNHLPAFTESHTYALPAIYPYATHPAGEWAYQAQFGYKFKRRTVFGGRYGTSLKINFSHVHAINQNPHLLNGIYTKGSDGYGSSFWKWGDQTYYQDLNLVIEKRFTKGFKLTASYINQFYNKTIVEGEGGMIHSDIFVADAMFTISPKAKLRAEAQYLATKDDEGDWLFGLLELSLAPKWMFTVSDMYNSGVTKTHYYQSFVTYNHGSHRIQLGWGRTRAGYNCSGGVCRYVPESKGFTVSYNYNF